MSNSVTIDVVSDVVCPWCFVGMKRLQKAVASLSAIKTEIHWRPFQLDPSIPREGLERQAYMLEKFGDADRLASAHRRLEELGAEDGISFDFAAISIAPNTLDAHRVIRWASRSGDQNTLVADLFSLYFELGKNIGEHTVLLDAASRAGMDTGLLETLLATDAEKAEVLAEIDMAARMGVTGVPCFIIAGKYAVMGAQSAQTLAEAIGKAAAEGSDAQRPPTMA